MGAAQAFNATSTSSSIFFASPKSMRLLSLSRSGFSKPVQPLDNGGGDWTHATGER